MTVTITLLDIADVEYIEPHRYGGSVGNIVLSDKSIDRALTELSKLHQEHMNKVKKQ